MRMMDFVLVCLALTLCGIAAPSPSSRGYVSVPGVGSYKLHEVNKPYHEAAQICEQEGAHLAVINTKEEEDVLANLLLGTARDSAFVGVNDIAVEGEMVTVLGEVWDQVGFYRWAPNEPNNHEDAEDCVTITRDRLMNDQRCAFRLSFFCEKKTTRGSSNAGAAVFATFSDGYVTLPGVGSYQLHAEYEPYSAAAQVCENEGAHLAVVETKREEEALVNLLNGTFENVAYVGVNDLASEGHMVTVLGTPFARVAISRWAENEPNDDSGVEDCAVIGKDSLMNDQDCGRRSSFFCEKNPPNGQGVVAGYVSVAGVGSYMLHEYSLPYSAAARVCEAEHAHLAVVNSKAEEDALMNLLHGARILTAAYVGVNDIAEEGRMVTVLNEVWSSVGYSKWRQGEPNDVDGSKDCVTIGLDRLMNGRKCTDQFGYFCEKTLPAGVSSSRGASSGRELMRTEATGPGYDTYLTVPGVGSYKLYQARKIYNEAAYVCEIEGAHLALVNSKAEEDVLANLQAGTESFLAFIGVNDIAVEGQMVTVFGQLWSNVGFTKWREGEPNDQDGAEDCAVLRKDRLIEDSRCGHEHSFFCEMNNASQSTSFYIQGGTPFAASFAAGYVTLPGVGSYRLHEEVTPYGEAARVCEAEAAHLAIVNSKVEEDALINLLQGSFQHKAYVGVNDLAVEGFMVTALGDPLASASFPKWEHIEPNDDFGIEDCVTIGRDRLMNDQECGIRSSFFCEKKTGSSSADKDSLRSGSVVGGYVSVAGVGSYMLHEYSLPYSAAARVCEAEHAHLAVVNSKAEEDALMNLLHGSRLRSAFVGVNDIAKEGRMVTVLGDLWSRVGYSTWSESEPNDPDGTLDCVELATDRLMRGRKCTDRLGYFCEKSSADAFNHGAASSYTIVPEVGSYKLHVLTKSYSEAGQVCDSEGAHLAIINSKREEDALMNMLQVAKRPVVYVGVNDIDIEGKMVTVLGDSLAGIGYYNWANGEPKNRNGLEDCATIRKDRLMRVRECGDQFSFICEKKNGCPGLPAEPTLEMECSLNGALVNCAKKVQPGTVATMSCAQGLVHKTRKRFFSMTCLANNHTWSEPLTKCELDCGRSQLDAQPYVSLGVPVLAGELPWHVGIYMQANGTYDQWCGGTLITPTLVVTAAHCFWNESSERQLDSGLFRVAAGKITRSWETPERETQRRAVAEIVLPARFSGKTNNYQSDFALVRLARRVEVTSAVNVACVDWKEELATLVAGDNGTVAGWGLNENGTRSIVLTTVRMAYVPYQDCWNMFLVKNPSFRKFITADKLCAGWTDRGTSVCPGDSGGGLVFPKETATGPRYFLRGVVSVGPSATGGGRCNMDSVAAFTDVTTHAQFFSRFVRP